MRRPPLGETGKGRRFGRKAGHLQGIIEASQKMALARIFLTSDSCFQSRVDWSSADKGVGWL